jgi:uncharacterized protein Usg
MGFSSDLECQLNGFGLTTAHKLYRIPDFESVLQPFVWHDCSRFSCDAEIP